MNFGTKIPKGSRSSQMNDRSSAPAPNTTQVDGLDSARRSHASAPAEGFRQLLRSASGTAILQATSNGAGFLAALLLARFLGREAYGRYAFSFAWAGLLALLATLGADRFLVRGIAVYDVHRQWPMMKGLLHRTNQLVVFTSAGIASIGCIVALRWMSPALQVPFCIAMLLVPLTALALLRQGAMQALGRVVSGQLPEYLIRPLIILSGICILRLWGGISYPQLPH